MIKELATPADTHCMELTPIAGIRVMPVTKVRPIESELTADFEIEPDARPDDDSYSPADKKAAGAEEPGEDAEDPEEYPADDPVSNPVAVHHRLRSANQISFFA